MRFKLYSLHDVKMEIYLSPFVARNDVEATRQLAGSMADPNMRNSPMCLAPSDFSLVCVGDFDDDSGALTSSERPVLVSSLADIRPLGTVSS